jgi:diaminopimelate decarboxylase
MSDAKDVRPLLPDSWSVHDGRVRVGGCDVEDLTRRFGTPLYIYDEGTVQEAARGVVRALARLRGSVSFAAKACSTLAVLRILAQEGLGLDAVSLGEMEAGLRAGFEPDRMVLHGNCKTDEELRTAVDLSIRAVVLDNLEEIERLEGVSAAAGKKMPVMLRLTLPFEAETHPAVQTAGPGSKFGFLHGAQEEREALRSLARSLHLRLTGLHTHMGSQISDPSLYARALTVLTGMADSVAASGVEIREINLGGGWAVPSVLDAPELSPEQFVDAVSGSLPPERRWHIAVELGRALVARAGLAAYRIGSVKWRDERRLIAVDGGMGDNPRPALYGSPYTAISVEQAGLPAVGPADVVGRYCESGDVLARNVPLPEVAAGDHLVVPVSGAYQLSMTSSYNGVPLPAVVLVSEGRPRLISRRGTVEDVLGREVALDSTTAGATIGSADGEAGRSGS